MHYSTLLAPLLASLAVASPVKRQDRGDYQVPGLGARKGEVKAAGGGSLDLAVAMLETDNMDTNYDYGDNKSEDAANFGIFKQNWLMLREGSGQFNGQQPGDWTNGDVLNGDLGADVRARQAAEGFYGRDTWFAGHRNGQSGLENPNTDDINLYKNAVLWIEEQILSDPKFESDDTRFWVDVTPI